MLIRKLLTAASVVALTAGGAYAQTTTIQQASVASSEVSAAVQFAAEADLATLATNDESDATFGLRVGTSSQIPAQNMLLSISVSNGTWETAIDGSALVSGSIGDQVVFSGGAAGGNTVEFIFTPDATATSGSGYADSVTFKLPVALTSCNNLTFSVTSFAAQDDSVDYGSDALDAPAVTCVNAISATLVADADPTSLIYASTPPFSDFAANAPDTSSTAVLGEFDLSINTSVRKRLDTGATVDAADVSGYQVVIGFATSSTGIASCAAVDPTDFFAASASASSASCTISGSAAADTATEDGQFTITTSGSSTVAKQAVSVTSATLYMSGGLVASEPFSAGADVENLTYTGGQTFGRFDWVGDATKTTNNVFRITGLTAETDGTLIVANSTEGMDGSYPFTVTPVGGEVLLTRTELTAIVDGNFGRADLTFLLEATGSVDVDRLMSANGVISSFGNGDPIDADGDNNAPL